MTPTALPRGSSPLALHSERRGAYQAILSQFTDTRPDITAAVLATVDGFEVAMVERLGRSQATPLAAMASSLTALGRAAGREAGHEGCERVVVESGNGKLLVRPIGASGRSPLLLCMSLGSGALLGSALWAADEIAKAVESL
jgi:predicted regulator of Ras-like GTPase activity (Roadblock/LC7/MglB family)